MDEKFYVVTGDRDPYSSSSEPRILAYAKGKREDVLEYFREKYFGKDYLIQVEEMKITEVFKKGVGRYLPFLFSFILLGLSFAGGLVLLIIPGFLFVVWFALAPVLVLNEDIKCIDAMKESKKLVQGNYLHFVPVLLGSEGSGTSVTPGSFRSTHQ